MAINTADTDRIDCHALRRDAQTRGHGNGDAGIKKQGLGCITLSVERCTNLLLIEPDGSEKVVALSAAAKRAAQLKAEEQARKQANAEAEAAAQAAAAKKKAEAEAAAQAAAAKKKAEAEAAAQAAAAKKKAEAEAKALAEKKAEEEAALKAKKEAEAKAKAEAAAAQKKAEEERVRREAEEKAQIEAEKKARLEAEAKRKAEEQAKKEAAEKAEAARKKAEAKAQAEAAAAGKKAEAEERARLEAKRKAKEQAAAQKPKPAKKKAAAKTAAKKRDLGKSFRRLIRETGPISLAHYIAESNALYYTSRDPLGAESDFITAPEISQMFGELIGLWIADLWVKMGARKHIHYVELGPGRGTLAQDALRTAARYEFEPKVHFVETSPTLRKLQLEAFPEATHHDDLSTLPDDAPLLIVANEFFDALPIHQLVRSAQGWHERMVGLEGDDLVFVAGDKPMDTIVPKSWARAPQGTMIETSPAASTVMTEIAHRLKDQGGAALIIDYGSMELRAGSTLQAIRAHEKVDPLLHPGEADLTAHVDFEMLKDVAEREGADVMGLVMQGDWLRDMGIEIRHEALLRKNPNEKDKLERQFHRLVDDGQMGTLFKVLGVCGRRWPFGVGFE